MTFLKLAYKSLINRKVSTLLSLFSISLSVALYLSVERTKRAAEEGFTQSVSQVDLLVGGRTGPLNLILYTVFNMGSATNNISWESYQEIRSKPEVEWTIPYSLGDGHKGFRVVATDENFYRYYQFRGHNKVQFLEGQPALDIWDVVLGSDVQKKLNYKIGDKVVIAHGVTRGEGVQLHDDKPFRVVGILRPTGTALDQSLYISLYGMEAIHIDWQSGAAPTKDKAIAANQIVKEKIKIGPITSFFLRTKSRIETLRLQREINDYREEPLLAIIPGVTLSELWRGLSQIGAVLQIISFLVMLVGLASMISSVLAGLNERRREMSILRSMGAGPRHIFFLLVLESCVVTFLGIALGILINVLGLILISSWLENEFGFYLYGHIFSQSEVFYLLLFFLVGTLCGAIPAIRASYSALKDGLSVRV